MRGFSLQLIKIGGVVIISGVASYLILFFSDSLITLPRLINALLLSAVLLGYIGVPVLCVGIFLWSLNKSKKVKAAVWMVFLLVSAVFIPLQEKCMYSDDIGLCELMLPNEPQYWKNVTSGQINTDSRNGSELRWFNIGAQIVFEEGIGDVVDEIKRVWRK